MLNFNVPKPNIPDITKKVVFVINDQDGVEEKTEKIHPVDLHNILLCNSLYIENKAYKVIYKTYDINNGIYYIHLQAE